VPDLKIIYSFLIILVTCACSGTKVEETPYIMPDLDHGLLQSPINIITDSIPEGHHQAIIRYQPSHEEISLLEHTIKVNYDNGSSINFYGNQYELQQFHFHTPAEHLIDGITYPMEMHLVHSITNDSTKNNHYFVLAMLFKMSRTNEFLQEFIDNVPKNTKDIAHFRNKYFNLANLVKEELKDYYHYTGSLTTPPYTETVHWAVSSHILGASPDQIATVNLIEGNNARHIQSVNGRKIEIIHQ